MTEKIEVQDFFDRSAETIVTFSYIVGVLIGLMIVGWQIFNWLQTNAWHPIPLKEAFDYCGVDLTAVYSPERWLGIANICQRLLSFPLSIGGPVFIFLVAHAWQLFVSNR